MNALLSALFCPPPPTPIINNAESFSFSSKSAIERGAFDEELVPFDSQFKGVGASTKEVGSLPRVPNTSQPRLPSAPSILPALKGRRVADGHKSTLTTAGLTAEQSERAAAYNRIPPRLSCGPLIYHSEWRGDKGRGPLTSDSSRELYERKQTMWKLCRDFLFLSETSTVLCVVLFYMGWGGGVGGAVLEHAVLFIGDTDQSVTGSFISPTADGGRLKSEQLKNLQCGHRTAHKTLAFHFFLARDVCL